MSRRARRIMWVSLAFIALLVSAAIAASQVKVPYWSFSPGAIRDTAGVISVEGVDVHPHDGTISFTTVAIQGRLTVFRYALAWLDPDATIVPEERVMVGSDPAENRQINLQLMDVSTQNASYVALTRLGYDVGTVGTGAMIIRVEESAPAEGVLDVGDTIVAVDATAISRTEELIEVIGARTPGSTVTLTVEPLDSTESAAREVTLAEHPDDASRAFLGVSPSTRDLAFEFPFEIAFSTGGVGGPSAGLAYTLALLDMLTPGNLTGGLDVAATGTIDRDGVVGRIGGLEHKAIAARRDGFDILFVPADSRPEDLEAAHRRSGGGLRIIEVSTLDEALEALVELGGDPLPES